MWREVQCFQIHKQFSEYVCLIKLFNKMMGKEYLCCLPRYLYSARRTNVVIHQYSMKLIPQESPERMH